jgi:hypothetical protein
MRFFCVRAVWFESIDRIDRIELGDCTEFCVHESPATAACPGERTGRDRRRSGRSTPAILYEFRVDWHSLYSTVAPSGSRRMAYFVGVVASEMAGADPDMQRFSAVSSTWRSTSLSRKQSWRSDASQQVLACWPYARDMQDREGEQAVFPARSANTRNNGVSFCV